MIRITLSLLLAVFATQSNAQTVSVRSGEHETFTRFVLDIPEGTPWTFDKGADGFEIMFQKEGLTIDASQAFNRVSTERVSAIRQNGKTVTFDLACDCVANAYVLRNRMLVVDVSQAPEPETETAEVTSPEDMPVTDFAFGDLLWTDRSSNPFFGTSIDVEVETEAQQNVPVAAAPTPMMVHEEIAKQVAHAATIGLLQPEPTEVPAPKLDRLDPNTAEPTVIQTPAPQGNMAFRNATTILTDGAPESLTDALSSIICPDPGTLNILDWASNESFDTQISTARAMLSEEFDRTSAKAVLKLAKTYIHFGFGQEALQTLRLLEDPSEQVQNLNALAEILEHGQVRTADPFSAFAECEGPVALWAVLARSEPTSDLATNRNSILTALEGLPQHLRSYLAPMLAQRATTAGATELADLALRTAQRGLKEPTPEQALAQAALDVETQDTDAAIETLEEIVTSNTGASPEAVIKLVEANLVQGLGVGEDTVRLSEALAVELGETRLGPELRRAQTIATAQLGDFKSAFEHLGVQATRDTPDIVKNTQEDVFRLLTQNATDTDFVVHAFDAIANGTVSDVKLVRAMASRFAALGFSDTAGQSLEVVSADQRTTEDTLLLARLALQSRKPRKALSYIEGMSNPDAEAVRARAMELLGDYKSAAALFASANQPGNSERSAWMAEDWEALGASETSPFQPTASALLPKQDEPQVEGMIANGQILLEDTANLRNALTTILKEN